MREVYSCRSDDDNGSVQKPETFQIFLNPACLSLDHGFQCFEPECVTGSMEAHRDPTAVGVVVVLVGAVLTLQNKSVTHQSRDDFASRQTSEARIVDTHESDGHGDTGIDR